jgi:hypothetical protein
VVNEEVRRGRGVDAGGDSQRGCCTSLLYCPRLTRVVRLLVSLTRTCHVDDGQPFGLGARRTVLILERLFDTWWGEASAAAGSGGVAWPSAAAGSGHPSVGVVPVPRRAGPDCGVGELGVATRASAWLEARSGWRRLVLSCPLPSSALGRRAVCAVRPSVDPAGHDRRRDAVVDARPQEIEHRSPNSVQDQWADLDTFHSRRIWINRSRLPVVARWLLLRLGTERARQSLCWRVTRTCQLQRPVGLRQPGSLRDVM